MTLRVLFVSDALGPPVRGNGTTLSRWMGSLLEQGVEISACTPDGLPPVGFDPHIVHAYHALRAGPAGLRIAAELRRPLAISLGGTDLYAVRDHHPEAPEVLAILKQAQLVVGAFDAFRTVLAEELGEGLAYATVRRGVYVEPCDPRPPTRTVLRVLLPAGLRPVKDPLLALQMGETLRSQGIDIRLRLLGPALDSATAGAVREALTGLTWAQWDVLPGVAMGGAYQQADVVWNTSLHEGGANAILEALAHGCAVYARRVPGNVEMLGGTGAPGELFDARDSEACVRFHAALLAETPQEAARRCTEGHAWLRQHHSPEAEVADLLAAYARLR